MKLYEITEAYNNLLDADLEQEQINQALNVIDDEFEVKAENIAKLISSINGDIETLKTEEKRLADKRKSYERKIESLKDYLFNNLQMVDKKKIQTPLYKISIQKNPAKLVVKDEKRVPDEYFKVVKQLDKTKLKNAVKDGLEADYAELVQEEGLRIR